MKGRNFLHYLAMALGLESRREGFLNPYSWKHNKMVWGMNLEAYTGKGLARDSWPEKGTPASQAITKPGDTPGCGKLLKPVLPPLVGNCEWGPRLIAVH